MENFLRIYFESNKMRLRILFNVLYYVFSILIVREIVRSLFGITYVRPKEINLPVIIDFVFDYKFIIVVTSYFLYLILFEATMKSINLFIENKVAKRTGSEFRKYIINNAKDKNWFTYSNGKYHKKVNYFEFEKNIDEYFNKDFTISDLSSLQFKILSSTVPLIICLPSFEGKIILYILFIIYFIIFLTYFLIIKRINHNKSFLFNIKEQIKKSEEEQK